MNQELLLSDHLPLQEGVDVEYKGARGGLPRDLWETYSAFANSQGGAIWLGVSQKDGGLEVHGVPDADKLRRDFWNTVHSNKISRNLLKDEDVRVLSLAGARPEERIHLVQILVPRAERRERPVYVGQDPFKGTFRRDHEGDYLCTESEVRRMFADQSEESADTRVLPGFVLQDLDPDSLRQYRNRFASRAPNHPWLSEDDQGLLTHLGGWRKERRSGQEGLTLAGLLMFGRLQAILDPEALPGFHLDYRERLDDDPEVRWSDRLTLDGTWEGNLFQFYQRVMAKLMAVPTLKSPFLLDAEGYRKAGTPLHEALQEALVNALIHGDYAGQGGIVLERYADHFEFSNPGTLLVSREQLLRGGVSECRNKALQRMFQMLGVGDKAGSGIGKIRSSWAKARWQSPRLQETLRPDRVQLVLPMVSMMPERVLAELRSRFGSRFDALDEDQAQVVVTAAMERVITNQRLQEMLPIHPVDITKLLQGLVRQGLLSSDGFGRWTRYGLAGSRPAEPDLGLFLPEYPAATTSLPEPGTSLPTNTGNIPNTEANIPISETTMPIKPPQLEVWESPELLAIANKIREKARNDPQHVRQAILQLCTGRFLTVVELASLLNKRPATIRDTYVSPLSRAGLLSPKFPQARHPEQAYTTTHPEGGNPV